MSFRQTIKNIFKPIIGGIIVGEDVDKDGYPILFIKKKGFSKGSLNEFICYFLRDEKDSGPGFPEVREMTTKKASEVRKTKYPTKKIKDDNILEIK